MSTPAASEPDAPLDVLIVQEVQLLLAEKRTALSILRTGIAIFAFPLSVLSALIATSKAYHVNEVLAWLIPLLLINLLLITLAVYLIYHSFQRLKYYDRVIAEFKRKHNRLVELLGR
jgi:uncharacterized membrane protein YidH (DUF202 family)